MPTRILATTALALLTASVAAPCAHAAASAASTAAVAESDFGILVMAHGGPPEWNRGVLDAVAPLAADAPLEVAFGMADACSLQEATRKLEARGVRRIAVVRLFVSGESWYERTEQIFGLRDGAPALPADGALPAACGGGARAGSASHAAHGAHPAAPGAPPAAHGGHAPAPGAHAHAHASHGGAPSHDAAAAHAGHTMELFRVQTGASFALSREGLLDAPEMGDILVERARGLSRDPRREDVLVLAHGPEDDGENERWLQKLDARAEAVRAALPFHRVQVETLREDWPDKRAAAEERVHAFVDAAAAAGRTAIVIPYRLFGFGPFARVLAGREYVADERGLLPHVAVTEWVKRQIATLRVASFRAPAAADTAPAAARR